MSTQPPKPEFVVFVSDCRYSSNFLNKLNTKQDLARKFNVVDINKIQTIPDEIDEVPCVYDGKQIYQGAASFKWLNEKMSELEKELETEMEKGPDKEVVERDDSDSKKKSGGGGGGGKRNEAKVLKLNNDISTLRSCIKSAELNETFVPNKMAHLRKWYPTNEKLDSFTSDIDESTVVEIMSLKNVENSWKVLLLMGIGVFTNHPDITYTEIMKKLAENQKLYLIIASSDYIYGTNYQFCHGYLGKDLCLTQEKMMQALGRIGRRNVQKTYSVRLRDDSQIKKLFYPEADKPEVRNMNRLFSR
jgi:hypothetical protein